VEFVDIYPTLCELAGLDARPGLEGQSAAAIMRDPSASGRTAARSQFLRTGIWKAPDGRDYMGYTIRTDDYRYVEWFDWETGDLAARELYDHRVDSQENRNVVDRDEHAAVVAELSRILKSDQ